jgi:hypothetical protein
MDRRRRDEEIPEKQLGKVISALEAMNNRAPKLGTKEEQANRAISPMPLPTPQMATPSSSNSDSGSSGGGSKEEEDEDEEEPSSTAASNTKRRNGRLTPSDDFNSKALSSKKLRSTSDDSNNNSGSSDMAPNKSQKSVTFLPESNDSSSDRKKKNGNKSNKEKTRTAATSRVGTRTTRGAGEALAGLLPDTLTRKKGVPKKKFKKDENVVVVKMLTGTLYLYRGENPRAEFVRTK